ncbi:MAG: hypothetical protein GWO26_00030 [Phycisphaerae bacterium]|nr:hypothetical protein [Phycisphaerae bacterium]
MFWDQQKGKYHFEITGHGEYAFVPIECSSAQSYTLEFDIEIVNLEYNSSISFGLYDPDMREQEPVNWKANYGRGSGGNGASIGYYGDSSSGVFPPGYDFTYQVNTNYHNAIVYDATEQKITWQVTRISDGAVVADYSSPDGIGIFTGIDRICATRVPQGATTEGYIDNVVLSTSYIGKLVSDLNNDCYSDFRDFAIFAGHWLECGNPFDPDCGVD